jgi:putative NADH-flavin reductase
MQLTVFGASGATGRRLLEQALGAGHTVTAVTRRPDRMPPRAGLQVVGGDVADAHAVDAAVAGSDAVLSALGVSYNRKPISVYSQGTGNIIAAMHRQGVKRLVVVSSAPLDPAYRASDSLLYARVLEPLFMRRPGRTLYEDLRRMESLVRASDLDWTIIRACWLFDAAEVTHYRLADNSADGMFTSRADLAASMLAQLADDRFIRRAVGVATTAGTPSIIGQIWRENITKPKRRSPPVRRTHRLAGDYAKRKGDTLP